MKTILTLALSFALCIFMSSYSFSSPMGVSGPDVGEDAPDFVLKGIDGKEVKLSSFKSIKPVVLIFGSCT